MNKVVTVDAEELSHELPAGFSEGNASLAISLARAEVDQQISTAHAFPRSITKATRNISSLATLDEQSAQECIYALPRGGKPIKGPSVRLAEIIASQWGNCRVGARVVHVDKIEKYVEAEGVFHDLESNTATTARVRRRISDKAGKVFNDDMIVVTGNAACSIAKRNAILGGVPKAVWRKAYESVEHVIAGDVKTLAVRREQALKAFAVFGVKPEQIFEQLGVKGVDDVTLDHIITLTGMHSALKSGEASVEDMFGQKQGTTAPPAPPAVAGTPAQDASPAPGRGEDGGLPPSASPDQSEEFSAADAYALGQTAREQKKPMRAPPEFRDNPAMSAFAESWLAGWRAKDEEMK